MLVWTWGAWPDLFIDFGRELYLPWQITEGRVLYRDLASFNGPLSPYVNAVWFQLFGISLRSLVLGNILITAGLAVMLYRVLLAIGGRASAVVGGLVFVTIFACAQLSFVGNYNFITPYSHDLTHGLVLSTACVLCFRRHIAGDGRLALALAGLLLGLTFLTKTEVFVAISGAIVIGTLANAWVTRRRPSETCAALAVLVAAALVPVAVAVLLFSRTMPLPGAVAAVMSPWHPLLDSAIRQRLTSLYYYRFTFGTLDLRTSLETLAGWSAWYGAVLATAYFAARRRLLTPLPPGDAASLLFVAAVASGIAIMAVAPIGHPAAPLPLLLMAWTSALLLSLRRATPASGAAGGRTEDRGNRVTTHARIVSLTWAVFSLLLLSKILFRTSFGHYGFALAMPATLGIAAVAADVVPAHVARAGGAPGIFRFAAAVVLLFLAASSLVATAEHIGSKSIAVGRGGDRFRADDRGRVVNAALEDIAQRVRPSDTLLVLPEGVMLNYLARRATPTRYVNFMPPELAIFGEAETLDALRGGRPDYVAIVHRESPDYGARFGSPGFGLEIRRWIDAAYEPVALVGAEPLRDHRFGIRLLKRRAPAVD